MLININSFDKVNKTIEQGGAELVQSPASKLDKNQAGGKPIRALLL